MREFMTQEDGEPVVRMKGVYEVGLPRLSLPLITGLSGWGGRVAERCARRALSKIPCLSLFPTISTQYNWRCLCSTLCYCMHSRAVCTACLTSLDHLLSHAHKKQISQQQCSSSRPGNKGLECFA